MIHCTSLGQIFVISLAFVNKDRFFFFIDLMGGEGDKYLTKVLLS